MFSSQRVYYLAIIRLEAKGKGILRCTTFSARTVRSRCRGSCAN